MSSSDSKSAAPPLRKRKSKRFDRSGASQRRGGASGDEAESAAPANATDVTVNDGPATTETVTSTATAIDTDPLETATQPSVDVPKVAESRTEAQPTVAPYVPTVEPPLSEKTVSSAGPSIVTDGAVRSKTLDERQICGRCGHELSMVNIEVDENVLIMESCDNCDARRWHLAGEPVELQQVLDHVGEHAGRRR